ncbi:uncharacterized protein Dana_GF27859 [Drosophila ananassae]|uniref:Uncharacterized protein n=1 Tax=Drosophila ananassae TaxID=7217 RepID=A0A0N8NZA6_DROAN|nr:uncharacterized protein Dana_GF27859 [Drosophila ananassae]
MEVLIGLCLLCIDGKCSSVLSAYHIEVAHRGSEQQLLLPLQLFRLRLQSRVPSPHLSPLAGQSIKFFAPLPFACTDEIQDGPWIGQDINMQGSWGAGKNELLEVASWSIQAPSGGENLHCRYL